MFYFSCNHGVTQQEMSTRTLYLAVRLVAQGLSRRQQSRSNNGVYVSVQSAPATLDTPTLQPMSKDFARLWMFLRPVTLTFDLSN